MELPRHPWRPLGSALRAFGHAALRREIWTPFCVLALLEGVCLAAVARFDLLPTFVLAPVLAVFPDIESSLHYPAVLFALPQLARALDLLLFLTAGAVAQGIVIERLGRAWRTDLAAEARPRRRQQLGRGLSLVLLAVLLVAPSAAATRLLLLVGQRDLAPAAGLAIGFVSSTLLFVAPAFVVLHGLSLRASVRESARLVARLPIAIPFAVVGLALLHAPGLVLRTPAIQAAVGHDPDWILAALLGPLPAQVLGSVLAATIAAYFALRTRVRSAASTPRPLPALGLLLLVLAVGPGCDSSSRALQERYAAERILERARLREIDSVESESAPDSTGWLAIASLYGRAVERLGEERIRRPPGPGLDRDLGRLACQALLGRAHAWSAAGRAASARRDYEALLSPANPYRSARGDAALGVARCADREGRWPAAYAAYLAWADGVREGTWPLRRSGLGVGAYVARRLRDRGDSAARAEWVDRAAEALAAAAARGELVREARTTRFGLLLAAEEWEAAYGALDDLRAVRGGQDGALLVAEASLLAGGLGRPRDALGLLAGLSSEDSPFDGQHRVTAWLLLGQIHSRAERWEEARRAYEHAFAASRAESGRSEALLGLARLHAACGRSDEARRTYRQLRESFTSTPAGLLAPLEETRLLLAEGRRGEAHDLVLQAIQAYRGVIQQFGTERPSYLAARSLGECLGLAGSWERGIAFLDSISSAFGRDVRAGSLLVHAARLAADEMDDPRRARALLVELHARYPDSDLVAAARSLEDSLDARLSAP
jgi:tetratricopeptide (TPR) repeat protein